MKVAAYIHVQRMRNPTGVGQHIIHMVGALARDGSTRVTVLAPRADLDAAGRLPAPLADLAVSPLPLTRKTLELCWWALHWPRADRWCDGADLVYCPAEAFVATHPLPLAVTVHDTHAFETDLPWSRSAEHRRFFARWRRLFVPIRRHARLILAVSEFTKSRLVALLGIPPQRIEVVGNGVEDAYFEPGPAVELPPEPYLYVIGGLTRRKGAEYLLDLAARLRQRRPDMRILVSGAGEAALERRIEEMPNVRRLGYVPVDRQVGLLRGSRMLVFLSRYEGFGIPPLEAMAAGTPAVVSDFGALPEVVADAGMVVDVRKPEEVLETVLRVDADSALRADLVARGRVRAEEFRWSRCAQRLSAALRKISSN